MEKTHVRHTMLHHDETLNTAAPSEALHLIRIKSCITHDLRMQHACASDFEPSTFLSWRFEPHVHLDTRFDEREEARAESDLRILTQIFFKELLEDALKMCERDLPRRRSGKAVELIELRFMRHVCRFIAEHLRRRNHSHLFDAFLCHLLEAANRYGRRVRARRARFLLLRPKSILHIACRVVSRNVQGVEVIPLILKLRAFGNAETHPAENIRNLADGDSHRMQPAVHELNIP